MGFTQCLSGFGPDLMSSQIPGLGLGYGGEGGGGVVRPAPGNTEFLLTGYDSQFDVEGLVDWVSDLSREGCGF